MTATNADPSSRQRGHPTATTPQLSDSNKHLVLGPKRGLTPRLQSQSYVTTDDQTVSKSWFRGPSGSHDRILISGWHLLFYRYRAPPLMRGRVCHLYVT
jgi:hypothetical protein